jgi:hypothetical protein
MSIDSQLAPRPSAPRDAGSALIMVLGAMTVAMFVVSGALTYGLQTSGGARHATAWSEAFAAAEAGVDDYLARLNQDDDYWTSIDCENPALQGSTTRSNGCGWGASTEPGWVGVRGADLAEFHYDVSIESTPVDGTIDLISTGRVGAVTRTIQVVLRRGGFGEFLYYTTYETKDPDDYSNPIEMSKCAKYAWAGRHSDCGYIQFIGGDKINGPVHSNDTIVMTDGTTAPNAGKGPWFTGSVTTSLPSCRTDEGTPPQPIKCYRSGTPNSAGHPRFDGGIAWRSEVQIPEGIGDLRQYVDPRHPTPQLPLAGCLYTGTTRIEFLAAPGSAPGTMRVWSPWSKSELNPGCGNASAPWPQTVPVPRNGLIMVQNVPSDAPPSAKPPVGACADKTIGGFPDVNDYNQTRGEASCSYGTVYVNGTLKGRVTVSADNNIIIPGNLTYEGGPNGTDALGLIASNSVQIYHPIARTCTEESTTGKGKDRVTVCTRWGRGNSSLAGSVSDPVVHASILTLQHSFEVQAYDVGEKLGKISLYGSIAQRFRGIVGQGSSGYLKDYNYDSRLRYSPPPYFLDPVSSAWGTKTFGEVAPRHGD